MDINLDRILGRLEELYQCGAQEDGTFTRMAYSPEDRKGREIFMDYFRKLGIEPETDAAGNLIARLEGEDPKLPAIMTGSHLDTVPDGGRYDGALGCVAGLEVCQTLIESGRRLRHPLEIVVFTDEEGFRFGSGMLGSGAMCGQDLHVSGEDQDMCGQTRGEVLKACGLKVSELGNARRSKDSVHCFLELHVEQGASLHKKRIPVGVVTSIAGVSRFEIKVTGEANHAGSTVMEDRKDALVAAARFVARVPEIVAACGNPFTVATVGTMKVVPNSVNVIPGEAYFRLEIRDQDEKVMETIEQKLRECLASICEEMGEEYSFNRFSYHEPAPMTEWVRDAIEASVRELDIPYTKVPSGAFHDSLLMTAVFPTGMIFVPSVGGISHSRYEFTEGSDIGQGCRVLLETVLRVDDI